MIDSLHNGRTSSLAEAADTVGSTSRSYEWDYNPDGSTPNPFKWNAAAGYQHVPFTGLYHVGAREYDPRTARWLQRDPIGQSSGDPNVYRYCGNDAVNLADPSGLQPPVKAIDQPSASESARKVTKLNAVSAFQHYRSGSGTDQSISFEDINTSLVRPEHFPKIFRLIHRGQPGTYMIADRTAFTCSSVGDWLMLGTITLNVQGRLIIGAQGVWEFSGDLSAEPDLYDFNAANRGLYGELLTAVGRSTSGKEYLINVVGDKGLVGFSKPVNLHGGELLSGRTRHRL